MKNLSTKPHTKRVFAVVLLLAMGFTFSESAAQCVTPPSGLVSWWRGENDATDFSGNNHGTLINGATFATGRVGQAFSFDGVDDGISIQKSGNLDFGANDFSIGAWINFTEDLPGPDAAGIFLNYAGLPFYGLFINPNGEVPNVYFRDGLGNEVRAEGTTPLNDGNWHYLVGIRDGQNGYLYVDGTLVATASNPSIGSITTSSCVYARIGAAMTGPGHCTSTNASGSYFKGLIDEVEIYNRAITFAEIQSTYNAGSAGKCTNQFLDEDHDGFTLSAGDCDDTNSNIFPGAPEQCDASDNDCDGTIDEGPNCWPVAQNCDAFSHEVFTTEVPNPLAMAISPGGQYGNYMYATSGQKTIYRVAPDGTAEEFAQGRSGNGNFLSLVFDNTPDHRYGGYLYAIVDYFGGTCYAGIDRILPDGTVESFVDGCGGGPVLLGAYDGEIDDQGKFGYNFFLADFEVDEFGRSPSTLIQISPAGGRSPFYSVLLRGVFGTDIDRFGNFDGDMLAANAGGLEWRQGDNSIYRVKPDGAYSVVIPDVGLGFPYDVLVDGLGSHSGNLFVLYSNVMVVFNQFGQELKRHAASANRLVQDRWGSFNYDIFYTSSNDEIRRLTCGQCLTPPSGLVSWWPGEGNASDIQDVNDGTLQNGTAFASGMVGQAFSFDGVDDVITVPASTNLGMTSAYTFDAWVNSIGSADLDRLIIARGDASAHDLDTKINRPLVGNTLQVTHNRTNGAATEAVLFAAPPLNQFFHLAVTFDGTKVRAYYNGVEAALVSATNTISAPLYTDRGWLFGRTAHPDYGGLGRFVGILDEMSIYNRALTAQEIADIYTAGSAGKCQDASDTEVTLRLQDQNGTLIPASQFDVAGQMVPQGGTISLPTGTHAIRLFPGLNGSIQGSLLHRVETVSVSGATQTVQFTWVTAPLQVTIVDQSSVPIPASQFIIRSATTELANGASVTLPVTDDPGSSTISGTLEAGYIARLLPGLNGQMHGGLLYREDQIELGVGGVIQNSTWVTAPLQVNVVDQNNLPIPASQFLIGSATTELPNGTSITLPVTDDPSFSTIAGTLEAGYVARLFPGLNGQTQAGLLHRDDQVELTATGLVGMFIWEIASGSLHLVDASEDEVSGASINQSFLGTISTGAIVSLPVTDNSLYAGITGTYESGYSGFSIQTAPGNAFAGPFTFELLSNEIFDPAFVLIDNAQYGLRFDLQPLPDCVSPPSGLMSWWPGDGNAADIKGSNDGTLQNGATFAIGKVDQAFSFDGMDDYIDLGDKSSLNIPGSLTISAWVLIQGFPPNQDYFIADFDASGHVSQGSLGILPQGVSLSQHFFWTQRTTDDTSQPIIGVTIISTNRWYHVAGVRDDNIKTVKLYVDGSEDANGSYAGKTVINLQRNKLLGRSGPEFGDYFHGFLDEVSIYNRALSASEIQSIYAAGSAGKCKECTPPEVSISGNDPVFAGTTHTYAASTNANDPTFEWSVTGGTINGSNSNSSVSITAGAAGSMTVSVNVADGVTNCSKEETKEVTVNPLPAGSNEVVFATNSVWLKEHAKVLSGNVIVNNASSGPVLDSQVELSVGQGVTTPAGVGLKANRIKVKQGAVVASDIFYNELTNNGTINGSQNSPLTLPVFSSLPAFQQASAGTQDITVNQNESRTLTAGAYGDILVKQNGTIVFMGGGTFELRSLNTGPKAKLLFDVPTEILIEGKLDTDENSYVGPQEGSVIGAADIVFYVAGINGNNGNFGATPKAAQLGLKNTVLANFYVPNGTLWLRQGTVATGAFLGRDVIVGEQVEVTLESAFDTGGSFAKTGGNEGGKEKPVTNTLPQAFALLQNYPNPFNPSTVISFELPVDREVALAIYNTSGQLVRTLVAEARVAGSHSVVWDGRDRHGAPVSSGVYVCILRAGEFVAQRKLVLMK